MKCPQNSKTWFYNCTEYDATDIAANCGSCFPSITLPCNALNSVRINTFPLLHVVTKAPCPTGCIKQESWSWWAWNVVIQELQHLESRLNDKDWQQKMRSHSLQVCVILTGQRIMCNMTLIHSLEHNSRCCIKVGIHSFMKAPNRGGGISH